MFNGWVKLHQRPLNTYPPKNDFLPTPGLVRKSDCGIIFESHLQRMQFGLREGCSSFIYICKYIYSPCPSRSIVLLCYTHPSSSHKRGILHFCPSIRKPSPKLLLSEYILFISIRVASRMRSFPNLPPLSPSLPPGTTLSVTTYPAVTILPKFVYSAGP